MWHLDFIDESYTEWLSVLDENCAIFVQTFITAITESSEDPWEIDGIPNIFVGKAESPYSMLYRAYLNTSPETQLIIVFAVDHQPFVKNGVIINGVIRLLEFDQLRILRSRTNIEASALKKLRLLTKEGE